MAADSYKTCSGCRKAKPAEEFYKNKKSKDGLRSTCKSCTLETNRRSVLKHHEKRKAEKREAYRALKDDVAFQEKQKAFRASRKAEKREYDRLRHMTIAAEVSKRAAAWNVNNRERRAAIVKAYDGRRRSKLKSGVSGPELRAWLAAVEKKCRWCGVDCQNSFHVDHIVPLSKDGSHELSNLAIACAPCNLRKNAKLPEQFMAEMIEH